MQSGNSSIWSFSFLLGEQRHFAAGVDPEGTGDLNGARAELFRHLLVARHCSEEAARLGFLVLLDECHGSHLAGTSKPGAPRLGQRLKPRDDLLRLEGVELERGLADGRSVAIGLRKAIVGRDLPIFGSRELRVVLLKRKRGPREQSRSPNGLASAVRQFIQLLRSGIRLAGTD